MTSSSRANKYVAVAHDDHSVRFGIQVDDDEGCGTHNKIDNPCSESPVCKEGSGVGRTSFPWFYYCGCSLLVTVLVLAFVVLLNHVLVSRIAELPAIPNYIQSFENATLEPHLLPKAATAQPGSCKMVKAALKQCFDTRWKDHIDPALEKYTQGADKKGSQLEQVVGLPDVVDVYFRKHYRSDQALQKANWNASVASRILYFPILKAGSTTLRLAVAGNAHANQQKLFVKTESDAERLKDLNFYTFAFIVDPLHHFLAAIGQAHRVDFLTGPFLDVLKSWVPGSKPGKIKNWDAFIKYFNKLVLAEVKKRAEPKQKQNVHLTPQTWYFRHAKARGFKINFVATLSSVNWDLLNQDLHDKDKVPLARDILEKYHKKRVGWHSNGIHDYSFLKLAVLLTHETASILCNHLEEEYMCLGLPLNPLCKNLN